MRRTLLSILLMLICTSAANAATDPALDKVLRDLDTASTKFKSAEADLTDQFFERVVRDTTTQHGSVYFLRSAKGTEMGLSITTPSKKLVHFADGQGILYDPTSAKPFNTFSTGKDKARSESFLTLGFGGSGKDLERAWDVKLLGTETITDGTSSIPVDKLDLIAKDQSVRDMFSHITIWVDPTRGISLKQESTTPEGDKRTVTYTHIRYNDPKLDTKKYALPKH